MATKAEIGPGWSQESGNPHGSPPHLEEAQVSYATFCCFTRHIMKDPERERKRKRKNEIGKVPFADSLLRCLKSQRSGRLKLGARNSIWCLTWLSWIQNIGALSVATVEAEVEVEVTGVPVVGVDVPTQDWSCSAEHLPFLRLQMSYL